MRQTVIYTTISFTLLLILFSCGKKQPEQHYTAAQQEIVNSILQNRAEKDSAFLQEDWSPLTAEERENFEGLKYYPIDLSLRFEGPIVKYESTIPDTIVGTKGDLRPALKYGYFAFTYQKEEYKLQIYKILRDDPELQKYLFLGFTDETTGKETYGTGRYIDIEENAANHYIVDFNLAYNPYCAYNPRYTCAIPSQENDLPFAVRAGEKIYKKH